MIHILLVDDHIAVGEGTKMLIEQEKDLRVTTASDSLSAVKIIQSQPFDLFLFDMNLPGINGLELASRTKLLYPNKPILIYSGYNLPKNDHMLLEAGVDGFISKLATKEQLITGIRGALSRRIASAGMEQASGQEAGDGLITQEEKQMLQLILEGRSNQEMAEALQISRRIVESNLMQLFGKLQVKSRAEAIMEAKRIKLVPGHSKK